MVDNFRYTSQPFGYKERGFNFSQYKKIINTPKYVKIPKAFLNGLWK